MNSEIPSFMKLSPMTAVRNDKQPDSRLPIEANEDKVSRLSKSSTDLQVSTTSSKEVEVNNTSKDEDDSSELVKKAVEDGNSLLQAVKRNLQFKVDDATNELVVKIVDSESGEVVRQIPAEEMLALIKRMRESNGGQQGLMIQDRA